MTPNRMQSPHSPGPASPLVFVHIPKTAGTSLRAAIEQIYGRKSVYVCSNFKDLERFETMSPDQRARYRVLSGHVPFGAHSLFPSPALTITFLRDPVERILSLYSYMRSEPTHPLYERARAPDFTLRALFEELRLPQVNNGQVRFLAGLEASTAPFGACDRTALDAAKHNLAKGCVAFGLVERFEESMTMLSRALNWPHLPVRRENVTRSRVDRSRLTPDELDMIHQANALGTELYAFASDLFEQRYAALSA
jgi:hypothetical protein